MTPESTDTSDMGGVELWQRVALEAVVNDDPAKAFALRADAYFDDVDAFPNCSDSAVIRGTTARAIEEWLASGGLHFDADEVTEGGSGKVWVRGIEYTDGLADEFGDD